MGLKGYRLWVMGQLDSTCRAPPLHHIIPKLFNPEVLPKRRVVTPGCQIGYMDVRYTGCQAWVYTGCRQLVF
jgi:hypothetical protein